MNKFDEILNNLKKLNPEEEGKRVISKNLSWFEKANRGQMLEGKTKDNTEITPSYLNDPFFKSPETAAKYARWKQNITPNPKRRFETPNLIINGYFHASVQAIAQSNGLKFDTIVSLGRKITRKFKNVLGLTNTNIALFNKEFIKPSIKQHIKNTLKI